MIKHISFDLWLTLIKSDPQFKIKRAEYLYNNYNPLKLTIKEIIEIIYKADKIFDRYNELSGKKISADKMHHIILQKMGNNPESISEKFLSSLKTDINNIALKFPPHLLNDNIHYMLDCLKKDGFTLNISSNTGFIEGAVLKKLLVLNGLSNYFDFAVYSDEINASKPSSLFFSKVLAHKSHYKRNEFIHVGDNYKTDYIGAKKFGFNALLIENKEYSYDFVKEKINEKNRKF